MIDKMDLSNKANSIRKRLGEDESSPVDIFSLVQTIDRLTLVFYPLGRSISGACIKTGSSSVIALNSEMSLGRQRFSLAHELYHLYFDEENFAAVCAGTINAGQENERRADQFASYFLMPQAALYEAVQGCRQDGRDGLALEDIIKLEQYFGVSRQAMLIRLQAEGALGGKNTKDLLTNVTASAARLGYDTALYQPAPEGRRRRVLGYYVWQAERLLQNGAVSTGKYEEWLLDAFREDIVFGEEAEGGELVD